MKRFEPDIDGLERSLLFLERQEKHNYADHERSVLRARYMVACHEIGETPLHDNAKDIDRLAHERILEQSQGLHGVSGFRSSIEMVVAHQELWGIDDEEKLKIRMRDVLKGSRLQPNYYEIKELERFGLFDEQK